jgi:hypothetical protein
MAGRFVFQRREEVVEEIIDGKIKTYASHAKPLSMWHGWRVSIIEKERL